MEQLFQIYQFTKDDAVKLHDTIEQAHSHEYEELIIGIKGKITHFIDYKTEVADSPFVSFISKGKIHRLLAENNQENYQFWILLFKSEFIPKTTFQFYSYYHGHANIPLQNPDSFERILSLCQLLFTETHQENANYTLVLHLLSALMEMIENERKKIHGQDTSGLKMQNITFSNFLSILEENFRRPEGVEFYAAQLFMSVRNLNLICQSILHKSVSEIIENRKLIEAKNLLICSDTPISEIGFQLGYNEKAYFTSVFKKKTGQTPTEFRAEMEKIIS